LGASLALPALDAQLTKELANEALIDATSFFGKFSLS
jgi:hypothetical protein